MGVKMVKVIEENSELTNINIKVVGVGNGGGNIVSRIFDKIPDVEFIIFNTDVNSLKDTTAHRKIQIGEKTTKGIGTGKDPEKGRFAASEDREKIAEVLKNSHIVFLIAGLGGGTGTGAAPVIAKIAKDIGALTIALVTTPFDFEGEERSSYAKVGFENLLKEVDTLIHISNQKLYDIVDEKLPFEEAFKKIDEIISRTISSISDLIYKPKLLNIDFANIYSVVENGGRGIVGLGYGKGEGRMEQAVRETIENPLIEKSEMMEAKNVLISITGGEDLTLKEVGEAVNIIQSKIFSPSKVLGIAIDKNLKDEVKITLLATGIGRTKPEREKTPHKIPSSTELPLESRKEDIDTPAFLRKAKEI